MGSVLSDPLTLDNGVLQGSVLSPTLFNIIINNVIDEIQAPVKYSLFADDLTIFLSCSDCDLGQEILQSAVNKILQWTNLNGFQISATQTASVHFCRLRHCNHDLQIRLDDRHIPCKDTIRYLEMQFDNRLTWRAHITMLKQACVIKLNLLKKLAHTLYGANVSSLLKIYHTIILSRLDYGSTSYLSASKKLLKSLNCIHHTAIRLALGAFRTSPIVSVLHEASVCSLDYRRLQQSINFLIHMKSVPNLPQLSNVVNSPTNNCTVLQHAHTTLQSLHIDVPYFLTLDTNCVPPWENCLIYTNLSLTSLNKKTTPNDIIVAAYNDMMSSYQQFSHLYTDGSKSTYGVGCAVVLNSEVVVRFSLPAIYTILSAELYAILLAIDIAVEKNEQNCLIITDSLSAIFAIRNHHKKKAHPIVTQIANRIFASNLKFVLGWVPSHVGIQVSDLADLAAKEASRAFPVPPIGVPPSDFKVYVKSCLKREWSMLWEAVPLTNKLRSISSAPCCEYSSLLPCRRDQVTFTRLRIGHTALTHTYLLKKNSGTTL